MTNWCNFDALQDFKYLNNVYENLFYCWKHHLYLLELGGDVKKWDEHSRVLPLLVQKTEIGVDGFKLHNMVADTHNKSDCIGRIMWSSQFSLCIHLLILSAFLLVTKFKFWEKKNLPKYCMRSRFFSTPSTTEAIQYWFFSYLMKIWRQVSTKSLL